MWRQDDVIEAAAAALESRESMLRQEQAVHGLDALEELDFHPLLAEGFASAGWGVLREQRYPSAPSPSAPTSPSAPAEGVAESSSPSALAEGVAESSRPGEARPASDDRLAKDSDRLRCDLVLTPSPNLSLADPIVPLRRAHARRRQAAGTLFESLAATEPPQSVAAPNSIPPDEAFWLEVKLVGQFCFESGIPGPNRAYASQLLRSTAQDLAKLAKDKLISHAALLLIHFTADLATAEHDLIEVMHRCLDRGLTTSSPLTRRLPITDRIGNTLCTLALIRPAST